METTKLGTEEQERFTLRPSAKSTIRFPLKIEINANLPNEQCTIPWPDDVINLGSDLFPDQLLGLQAQHVNLSVAVAHVADNAAVLHLVHVVTGHHVLVPSCRDHYINTLDYLC